MHCNLCTAAGWWWWWRFLIDPQPGLTRLLEVQSRRLKKGKSSKFNSRNDEQIKNTAIKFSCGWKQQKTDAQASASPKNCSLGLKTGVLNGFQNCFCWSNSTFLRCKGHNWNIPIEKINFHFQIWSHKGSTFFKKRTHFGQNSRPGETDPYGHPESFCYSCLLLIHLSQNSKPFLCQDATAMFYQNNQWILWLCCIDCAVNSQLFQKCLFFKSKEQNWI